MYKTLIRFLFGYKTFSYNWLLIVCIRLTELIFCGLYSMKMIELHIIHKDGTTQRSATCSTPQLLLVFFMKSNK